MRHGSLFSGIGGFDIAAQWVGWNNIFQVEKDDWCRRVLAKNFPKTERFADIKNFTGHEYTNRIDVISGGFPCQPFSVAGQRKGKDDDRYLWEEMLRVITTIKPTYVVGENVTGIIGMALDTVLSDLEAQDYTTETFIIPACSKNAWHRRDRVWIIAYANGVRRKDEQKENGQLIHNRNRIDKTEKQVREQQQCRTGKSSSIFTNTDTFGELQSGKEFKTEQYNTNGGEGRIIPNYWEAERCNCISADTDDTRCEEQRQSITDGTELFAPKCSSWWEAEPGMGRVVDGFPGRVDRLKGLGNAIVPQIAYEIFKAIESLEK